MKLPRLADIRPSVRPSVRRPSVRQVISEDQLIRDELELIRAAKRTSPTRDPPPKAKPRVRTAKTARVEKQIAQVAEQLLVTSRVEDDVRGGSWFVSAFNFGNAASSYGQPAIPRSRGKFDDLNL